MKKIVAVVLICLIILAMVSQPMWAAAEEKPEEEKWEVAYYPNQSAEEVISALGLTVQLISEETIVQVAEPTPMPETSRDKRD